MDGTEGEGLSGLKAPRGVGADGQGYFYVTDTGHGRVLRYATSGAFDQVVNQYDTLSTGQSGNLSAPATVSAGYLNGKLYCYVGDPVTHQINVYGFQR